MASVNVPRGKYALEWTAKNYCTAYAGKGGGLCRSAGGASRIVAGAKKNPFIYLGGKRSCKKTFSRKTCKKVNSGGKVRRRKTRKVGKKTPLEQNIGRLKLRTKNAKQVKGSGNL